jgi:hypothetical protein
LGRKERNRRSIWRELSFFIFIVKSNAIPLTDIMREFADMAKLFLVEKRIKIRPMQLAKRKLS